MANLVVLFGPPASGKAAIGFEISRLTGAKFFHNHLTADAVSALFGWGTPAYTDVAAEVRLLMLSKALERGADVVFTFVWCFDLERDNLFIRDLVAAANRLGAGIHFVELLASRDARLAREGTPLRLELKPAKRDVERARAHHARVDALHTMNSSQAFPYPEQHMLIDTERVSPAEAASRVVEHFSLQVHEAS